MCDYLVTDVLFVYSALFLRLIDSICSDSVVLLDYVEPFFYYYLFFARVCLEIIENDDH